MTIKFDVAFVRPGSNWPDRATGSVTIPLKDLYAVAAAVAVAFRKTGIDEHSDNLAALAKGLGQAEES